MGKGLKSSLVPPVVGITEERVEHLDSGSNKYDGGFVESQRR